MPLRFWQNIVWQLTNKQQKYLIWLVVTFINALFISTFLVYTRRWYVFLSVLALASGVNTASALLIGGHKLFNTRPVAAPRLTPRNYLYVLPCYNETAEELRQTIQALTCQQVVPGDRRMLFIICDGIVTGAGQTEPTSVLLKKLLQVQGVCEVHEYLTWDGKVNVGVFYTGLWAHGTFQLPFFFFIKQQNYGKRDSLVFVRQLCFAYNKACAVQAQACEVQVQAQMQAQECEVQVQTYPGHVPDQARLLETMQYVFESRPLDYIIGVDGDTVFDYNCSYELIQGISRDSAIQGCVGLVMVSQAQPQFSPWSMYQYAEYLTAQCLRRHAQSLCTQQVTCLSGCIQILRVSDATCGPAVLRAFNYLPFPNEHIFRKIRSYASEDRNHVSNMFDLFPKARTTQTLDALAYTSVPTSLRVFLSQRRRWSLGALANDLLLVQLASVHWGERIAAAVNVVTFFFTPFFLVATGSFLHSLVTAPSWLMLYLSTLVLIPLGYSVLIPFCIKPLPCQTALYFYCCRLFFLCFHALLNLCVFLYALACMDVFTWGKTREIVEDEEQKKEEEKEEEEKEKELSAQEVAEAIIDANDKALKNANDKAANANDKGANDKGANFKATLELILLKAPLKLSETRDSLYLPKDKYSSYV
jgi:chitin synthase